MATPERIDADFPGTLTAVVDGSWTRAGDGALQEYAAMLRLIDCRG